MGTTFEDMIKNIAEGAAETFKSAFGVAPLHEKDLLEIAPKGLDGYHPEGEDKRAINFQHILETGKVPQYTIEPVRKGVLLENAEIDLNADDAYIQALDTIRETTGQRILEDPDLQALLNEKETWSHDDRAIWEEKVSTIVSEEMDKTPGLDDYRAVSRGQAKQRLGRLNGLSEDIEKGTTNFEFDCENMSITEGIILQQMDNGFLPEVAEEGNLKTASNYFYVHGAQVPKDSDDVRPHAYIISSATGNVIESTSDPSFGNGAPYHRAHPDKKGYTFERFIEGDLFVDQNSAFYGGMITKEDIAVERRNIKAADFRDKTKDIKTPYPKDSPAAREGAIKPDNPF